MQHNESKIIPVLLGTFLTLNIVVTSITLVTMIKKKKEGCGCKDKK